MGASSSTVRITRGARAGFAATDAVTAVTFLWTWIAPGSVFFAEKFVMEMVYVLEFFSLHAAGFLASFIVSEKMRAWQRFAGITAIGSLYVGYFVWLGIESGIWWPAVVMAVFVFGKIRHALFQRGGDMVFRFGVQWGVSMAFFVLLTGLSFALPWPYLGITPGPDDGMVQDSGSTIAGAHTVIVAGFLYFSVMTAIKYRWSGFFVSYRG